MRMLKKEEISGSDTHRLPSSVTQIRVLSGNAWVTAFGKDIILHQGESALFVPGENDAVVTALGDVPLVVEELG